MPQPLLKYASALLGLLAPVAAGAVNMGDMEIRSALEQNFEAEIPLTLEPGESLKGLRAGLGSAKAFAQAKIPRPGYLADFHVELADKTGRPIIRITSAQAVKETYLTLLVQLDGPKGNVLRKFNVLLDPPSPRRSAVIATATAPQTAATTVRRYGPVKRGESLWTIARRVSREQGFPMAQALAALHDANPQAFVKGRRQSIKVGAVLNVPYRPALAKAATPPPPQPAPAEPAASLKLLSPQDNQPPQSAAEAAMREKMDETAARKALKLAKEAQQESDDNRSYLARIEQQMAMLRQTLMNNAMKASSPPPSTGAPPKPTVAAAAAHPPAKPVQTVKEGAKPADKAKDAKRKTRHRRHGPRHGAEKKP